MLCDRCHFSMIANKRQKEVNAHVSKLKPTHKKPKSHILCSKEGKQIRLARLQHRQNEIAERTNAHRSRNHTHAMNNFIEPDRASNSGLSTSSMSGESDNDSLKDDLLCSFDKSRQFDHRLLHSVSLSMEPNIHGRKRYLKTLKHQDTRNHFLTPTSAKMHKKVRKSKKIKSIAASIEQKKLKNKPQQKQQKLRNGRELRNELREMKRESKLERELCKKMRLQNGRKGKQIGKRLTRSSWKLRRSASAMAKLNEDTAEVRKDRAIKQRLTSLAMRQIDTVQYENSRYRRRKN